MRDLTKVLNDAEVVKLRALLAQSPDLPVDDHGWQEYPKMLFHRDYIDLYRLVKSHPDPLVKKEAQQNMRRVLVIVHDIGTEEDYLADGWRTDPNEFIVASIADGGLGEVDPRIPTGREGRRAHQTAKATREAELRELRRRYAELTGTRLADDHDLSPTSMPVPVPEAPAPVVTAPVVPTKREKVAAATKRATTSPSAHV